MLTLPAIKIDEELSEGRDEERQPHPGAGHGVGEAQPRPAALGRHHRGRLVEAGEPQTCGNGEKIARSCPKSDLFAL